MNPSDTAPGGEGAAPAPSSGEVTTAMNSTVLRTIGKYELTGRIGIGTVGEVWIGRHPNLRIPVAVKILSPEFMRQNPDYQKRFLNEAHLAAKLNHPRMVRIYDADIIDGEPFLVMEYMPGGTLGRLIRASRKPLPVDAAIGYVLDIGEALAAAHALNIIHRDIKPDNMMLDAEGHAKLADLGLAKNLGTQAHITSVGTGLGTPLYMSPEQALDARKVDPRSDIYSLGASLYHMVTGTPPYSANHTLEVIQLHLSAPIPSAHHQHDQVPGSLGKVLSRTLAKCADDRYQNVGDLLADLRRVRAGREPSFSHKATTTENDITISRRHLVAAAIVVGVLVLVLVVLLGILVASSLAG